MRTHALLLYVALVAVACQTEPTGPLSAVAPGPLTAGGSSILEQEIAAARAATARYHRLEAALADGFVDIDVFVPGMGHHFLAPARLDATFAPREPEILVYIEQPNGRMRLVAVEYAVPTSLVSEAPEGFTGDADVWHENTTFGLWTLHAWIWLENPDGLFSDLNPRLN